MLLIGSLFLVLSLHVVVLYFVRAYQFRKAKKELLMARKCLFNIKDDAFKKMSSRSLFR